MIREENRGEMNLRRVQIGVDYLLHAEGSALIEMGNTKVLCAASITDTLPPFLEGSNQGWITSEYSMLPRATHSRKSRESTQGKVSGRTHEIQRLIGRSMRAVCDLRKIPGFSIYLDCDVIQADGGTRTASVTGAYVALETACQKLVKQGKIAANPLLDQVAAVSVGLKEGRCLLDLNYQEDSQCDVDMNVVMTGDGRFIEVQATAEKRPYSAAEHDKMLEAAKLGIKELLALQREAVKRAKN